MTAPIQHNIITGAYLPIIKSEIDIKDTDILFKDNFPLMYERFGITRDEMMVLMPQVMTVDILSGIDKLKYIGEKEVE